MQSVIRCQEIRNYDACLGRYVVFKINMMFVVHVDHVEHMCGKNQPFFLISEMFAGMSSEFKYKERIP